MSALSSVEAPTPDLDRARQRRPPGTKPVTRRHPWPTAVAQREIILALTLLLCYGFFRQVPAWNENSRYDLVRALVDDGTTRIDPYHQNTGDKALYNGHYYSDKAPGTSFLGVPIYLLLKLAAGIAGSGTPDPERAIEALTFAVSAVPTVLLVLLLLRFLRPQVGECWALVICAGYGLGSLAFPFATMFFGHATSAFFLFAAFYALWRHRTTELAAPRSLPALAGLLAGWAVLVDLSALLGVLALFCYAVSYASPVAGPIARRPILAWGTTPLLMVAGAAMPALLLLGYNWVSFGGPFHLGYNNLEDGSFAAGMGRGILGVTMPRGAALNEILFGPRGLLILAPWLALAPLGLLAVRGREVRREMAVGGAIVLAFLLFNAGYYLPLGGGTPGPRFLTPALPFAAVLVALAPRAFRPLIALQIAFSAIVFFVATTTMPKPEAERAPLADLWVPLFLARDLTQTTAWIGWGLHGAQPLLVLGLAVAVAAVAVCATTRSSKVAHGLTGVMLAVLLLLVLGFTTPLDSVGGTGLVQGAARGSNGITIVDAGVTPLRDAGGKTRLAPWAQIENGDQPLQGTLVVFTVYGPEGNQMWSAWYGNQNWRAGERKHLAVEWTPPGGAPPSSYRFQVNDTSEDRQVSYRHTVDAGAIRLPR